MRAILIADNGENQPIVCLYGTNKAALIEILQVMRFLAFYQEREFCLSRSRRFSLIGLTDLCFNNFCDEGFSIVNGRARLSLNLRGWTLASMLIEPLVEYSGDKELFQWLSGPEALEEIDKSGVPLVISYSDEVCW